MRRSTVHRSRPKALFGLIASLILVLAACAGETATSEPADGGDAGATATTEPADGGGDAGETVSLSGQQFSPSSLTIPVGTTVTFTDTSGHTVTEGTDGEAADDPFVDESGGSEPIEVVFDEAGTFNITCTVHPSMNMTITVEG
jgi:plastocyanin